jgi:hypothetical protein
MVSSYLEFINESLLNQLIMEGKIQYSPQFIQVLKNTNTEIGKTLISLYNQDVNATHNYIDLSNQEDSATFISDNKYKQIIGEEPLVYKIENTSGRLTNASANHHIYNKLNFEVPSEILRLDVGVKGKILGEVVGENGNVYVLFESESGEKTILNKKALSLVDDREFKLWNTNRNPVKIGRLAQSLLTAAGQSFTPSDIEKFVNAYKSTIKMMNDELSHFDIVSGEDIIYWYRSENYANNKGTLGNSCMANCDSYLEMYANNSNIQMVILYDKDGKIVDGKYKSDKILGRALLWKLDNGSDIGPYFMDRIYTNNDSDINLFIKFAEINGYWVKDSQTSCSSFKAVLKSQSKINPYLQVSINYTPDSFPYLDTLCYFDFRDKVLHTNEDSYDGGNSYLLNDTSGGYDDASNDY